MTSRERAIVALLERYEELVDPSGPAQSSGQVGVPLMPPTYTADVRELERLLREMREVERPLWWHLNEHFLAATWVIRVVEVKRRNRRGKYTLDLERQLVRVGDRSDPRSVAEGVAWLADNWGLKHEPMLPGQVLV